MALYMGAMHGNRAANLGILAGAAAIFAGSLVLVRSQATVDHVDWMRAMIPHHSIAILTSERATITDPRVRDLAARIVEAQRAETAEMQALTSDLANPAPMAQ